MSLSMYQASVPAFVRTLTQLSAILDKAEAYAAAKKIDPLVLTGVAALSRHVPVVAPDPDRLRLRQGSDGSACGQGRAELGR